MNFESVLETYWPQLKASALVTEPRFTSKIIKGGDYPEEYVELRKSVYVEEKSWLDPSQMFDVNDEVGFHILVYDKASGKLAAATLISPAHLGDYAEHAGLSRHELSDAVFSTRSTVAAEFRRQGLMAYILYLAMHHARLMGFKRYVGYVEDGQIPGWKVFRYRKLLGAKPRTVTGADGNTYQVFPIESTVVEGAINAFRALPEELKENVRNEQFLETIIHTVFERLKEYYRGPYFTKVREHRLTHSEYVFSLMNKYKFVEWTTRILGRAVGMTFDAELRAHYAEHLSGEINHEKWVENDLTYLDADFEFTRDYLVPDVGIMGFMFAQEALTASRLDPVLLMGVPIAIEAASAFLSEEFIKDLKACIKKWGFDQPSKGCTFFSSHIHTDGAVDGHWLGTLKMIPKYVESEQQMQFIVNVIHVVMDSLDKAYNSYCNPEPAHA